MPGHLVHGRADIVLAVHDGHVLIQIQVFPKLLETGMEISDVGDGIENGLAFKFEHESQRRMRSRVLRTEVERPVVVSIFSLNVGLVEQVDRHDDVVSCKTWAI